MNSIKVKACGGRHGVSSGIGVGPRLCQRARGIPCALWRSSGHGECAAPSLHRARAGLLGSNLAVVEVAGWEQGCIIGAKGVRSVFGRQS
jgi:hypothetical protein